MYPALVEAWRGLNLKKRPFILPGDEFMNWEKASQCFESFEDYIGEKEHGRLPKWLLHTGLIPVPYAGSLSKAKVFILMANPGFGPHDYYAESNDSEFRKAAIGNLRQDLTEGDFPMIYLNPKFSWHGGSVYWRKKFANFLDSMECSYKDALAYLSNHIAVLEYSPYHSVDSTLPSALKKSLRKLRSVELIRTFVHEKLVPKARAEEIVIISVRGAWGLNPQKNVIVYDSTEWRPAHLSLKSRGGKKINEFLKIRHS